MKKEDKDNKEIIDDKKDKYIVFAKNFKYEIKKQCTFVHYNIHWFYNNKK